MEEVKHVQLSQIAELITKGTTPTTLGYTFQDEGVNFLKIECFDENGNYIADKAAHISDECNEKLKRSQLKEGDILFSIAGAIGRVGIVTAEMLPANTNQALAIIRISDEEVYLPYIKLILTSPIIKKQFERKKQGVAQLNLSLKDINDLVIPIPPKEKQVAITELFLKVKGILTARSRELLELDELIKARFVEMFGNPVNNEKGFVKAPMGDYMTLLTDFSSNGSYKTLDSGVTMYDEPNYAWMVRTTDLESGDMTSIKYIDENAYELLAKSKIYGGEIIMNKIGSAGKIYLMPQIDMPASLGRNAFMFRYDDRINVKFLYHLLTSEYGQREIQQYVRGAVTKTITKNDARAVLIMVPPIELQNEFEAFVKQVDKSKVAVQKALDETQTLFDSLMQEYFG